MPIAILFIGLRSKNLKIKRYIIIASVVNFLIIFGIYLNFFISDLLSDIYSVQNAGGTISLETYAIRYISNIPPSLLSTLMCIVIATPLLKKYKYSLCLYLAAIILQMVVLGYSFIHLEGNQYQNIAIFSGVIFLLLMLINIFKIKSWSQKKYYPIAKACIILFLFQIFSVCLNLCQHLLPIWKLNIIDINGYSSVNIGSFLELPLTLACAVTSIVIWTRLGLALYHTEQEKIAPSNSLDDTKLTPPHNLIER